MIYTQEPRANDLTPGEFWDALSATNKEFASVSWDGFMLFGDRKSVSEVSRLMHKESFIKPLQNRIDEQKRQHEAIKVLMQHRIDELEARLDQHDTK